MAVLGRLLRSKRAGKAGLAWHAPGLAGAADTLGLSSPDFPHEGTIPKAHAGKRLGGRAVSPALTWQAVPAGTAQLLLVIEDPDAPTALPYNHGTALLDPSVTGLAQGDLKAGTAASGVRLLGPGTRRGYLGPAPLKGHGPHRYVFQLFALDRPLSLGGGGGVPDDAEPRDVMAAARAASGVLARGRLDGFYERR